MAGQMETARRQNSLGEDNIRNLVDKTQGMLRSGLISVIEGGSDIFSGEYEFKIGFWDNHSQDIKAIREGDHMFESSRLYYVEIGLNTTFNTFYNSHLGT